ncbi:ABC transporter substrate-binding protein [Alcaligenaceae bacterium CGII-47]|nr:ABC transporter substrate-binding protein [Alcaligenaceae bacterium CGII-47]
MTHYVQATATQRMLLTIAALAAAISPISVHANDAAAWRAIQTQAQGQTVYFNAWGGDQSTNAYIDWVARQIKAVSGITLKHVKVTDTAEAVQRIEAEKRAGRNVAGSVDLLWVNGENFQRLKKAGLLYGPWAEKLPNWQYIDMSKPVRQDFSESTDGLEAPWGAARLTFLADRHNVPLPPTSTDQLLAFAQAHPGRVTYPSPPDFYGTTFLKQLLLMLAPSPEDLNQPVTPESFARNAPALWAYLDKLHPFLWRMGKAFPSGVAPMHRMLADGELLLSITFNPNEGASLIAQGRLPASVYAFGFSDGMIGNVHFLAIPYNASAKAGAQVVVNFMLSPQAQAKKADPSMWGDPTVLNITALPPKLKAAFDHLPSNSPESAVPTLAEPDASWMSALESAWIERYGAGR